MFPVFLFTADAGVFQLKSRCFSGKSIPQFGIRIVHKKVGSFTNILYLYR